MKRLFDAIAEALLIPVSRVVTALLGLYTMAWGLWVVAPFWDTFTHAAVYSALIDFIPHEFVWGLIAIAAGLLTMLGLIKHFDQATFNGAGISGLHWTVISIFYFMGDVANTAGITAVFVAVLSFYIYLNCKTNYKIDHQLDDT